MTSKRTAESWSVIPHYFLYGEAHRDVDHQFLHVETIESRSRKHGWSILPHVHGELHHLLFITSGGGQYSIDANTSGISAPLMISVPAQCVHGFAFEPGTEGWIVTSSSALLRRISQAHPEFESLLYHSARITVDPQQVQVIGDKFRGLVEEFLDERFARRAAAESAFLAILVDAIRIMIRSDTTTSTVHHADVDLVFRYRGLIEKNFRARVGATEYAARLCVCHERLRSACVRVTGSSPLLLLNARRLLEAKRCLLYTNMSVAEVAYQSGFEDPAYFSRFFTRNTGKSPRDYRLKSPKSPQ